MSDENRIISQEEIEEILRNSGQIEEEETPAAGALPDINEFLTDVEQDALGEMGNICMGTAATTMYTLIGKKVNITTPKLSMHTWESLAASHVLPFVVVEISYIEGIEGNNLMLLKEFDVALITDLLMGGDGNIDPNNIVLDEIHLSAIREVMNQMVGSSSTSLAQLLGKTINISTPTSRRVLLKDEPVTSLLRSQEPIVKIAFRMEIEGLLESEIMQVLPANFAKQIAEGMLNPGGGDEDYTSSASYGSDTEFGAASTVDGVTPQTSVPSDFAEMFGEEAGSAQSAASAYPPPPPPPSAPPAQVAPPPPPQQPPAYAPPPADPYGAQAQQPPYAQPPYGMPPYGQQPYPSYPPYGMQPPYGMPPYDMQQAPAAYPPPPMRTTGPVRSGGAANVQEVDYPHFDSQAPVNIPVSEQQNIYRLLDVPMEVMVELGRTKKTIKQVLDMNVGSVIVLEKLAGEEVEILVNGIQVARGEVVVIDDSYGVRVTELNPMMLSEAAQNSQ